MGKKNKNVPRSTPLWAASAQDAEAEAEIFYEEDAVDEEMFPVLSAEEVPLDRAQPEEPPLDGLPS